MFCSNCGKEIREDDAFCPYCGMKQNSTVENSNINLSSTESSDEKTARTCGILSIVFGCLGGIIGIILGIVGLSKAKKKENIQLNWIGISIGIAILIITIFKLFLGI